MPTITGTVQDERENLYEGPITFENLDAPCAGVSRLTGPGLTDVNTGSDGTLPAGFKLAPGRTKITVNGKSRTFVVPNGAGTYDLNSLLASAASLNTRTIVSANTIADLQSYSSSSSNFIAFVIAADDGTGALNFSVFKWDAAANNAHDGIRYVRPSDFTTAGLWVRIL